MVPFLTEFFTKKTHTKQYLHASSHHFPAQKFGVLSTLATRALRISNEIHLEKEKSHLLEVFKNNGYNKTQSLKAFQRACKGPRVKTAPVDPISKVHLSFIKGTKDMIAHFVRRKNISSSFKPLRTIKNSLSSAKDPIDPKDMKCNYLVPCSCGIPYIRETG